MDVREKLVELLEEIPHPHRLYPDLYVDRIIAKGVTVHEWISVKEPPKERGEYLCYFKYEPESQDIICQNTYYGSGYWMAEPGRVTHWTYLPQQPKGE